MDSITLQMVGKGEGIEAVPVKEEKEKRDSTAKKTIYVLSQFFKDLGNLSTVSKLTFRTINALNVGFGLSILPKLTQQLSGTATLIDTFQVAQGARDAVFPDDKSTNLEKMANFACLGAEIGGVALFLNDIGLVKVCEFTAGVVLLPIVHGFVGIFHLLTGIQQAYNLEKDLSGKERTLAILKIARTAIELLFRSAAIAACVIGNIGTAGTLTLAGLGIAAAGMGLACTFTKITHDMERRFICK